MSDTGRESWERVHQVPDGWYPNEFVVRFLAKYVRKRTGLSTYEVRRPDVRRVLDLGCGTGRHVVMLAREGYEAAGLDISENAVSFAASWLAAEGLAADLRAGSATALPWGDGAFDAVLSHGVLDHLRPAEARQAADEARRVLRPGGLFYLSLASTEEYSFGQGTEVEPFTFVLSEGMEAGQVQQFFTMERIFALLEPGFEVLDVVFDTWRPCHGRGFSAAGVESLNALARFHVAAEVRK